MIRRHSEVTFFTGAAVAGLAGAFLFARFRHHTHRHNLFSSHPTRRFAALGWLENASDPATLPLLRDYVAWEAVPVLRNRAVWLVRELDRSVR
ncbi:MAG: hypothetical protein H0W15_02345 [Gemmatimonadales bacterium]|nr:hypothetical protein [Gemmatimonadales bacterium]